MRAAHALLFSAHRPVGEDNYIVTPRRQKREKRRMQRITLSRTLEFTTKTQSEIYDFFAKWHEYVQQLSKSRKLKNWVTL